MTLNVPNQQNGIPGDLYPVFSKSETPVWSLRTKQRLCVPPETVASLQDLGRLPSFETDTEFVKVSSLFLNQFDLQGPCGNTPVTTLVLLPYTHLFSPPKGPNGIPYFRPQPCLPPSSDPRRVVELTSTRGDGDGDYRRGSPKDLLSMIHLPPPILVELKNTTQIPSPKNILSYKKVLSCKKR